MIEWTGLSTRLERLARGARPGSVLSVTLPLAELPALPWTDEWIVWQRPQQGLRLIGIGAAMRVESDGPGRFGALGAAMQGLRDHWRIDAGAVAGGVPPPLTFAGFAFTADGGAPLRNATLPNATLQVPAVLLREQDGRCDLTFTCTAEDAAEALPRWRAALAAERASRRGPTAPPRFVRTAAPLADLAFLARGGAALAAIDSGRFEKLVLTRHVRLTADRTLQPAPVLAALAADNPNCAVWGIARGGKVFLGASPEALLSLRGGHAEVDALAGTAWTAQAGDVAESTPGSLSLADDKNRREHDLVVTSVRAALAPLCESVSVPERAEVLRLHDLSHLRRRIVAEVRPGIDAFDLVARLHPTPAVGGTPTAAALDWLAAHGDRRGAWYTGGIGWLDANGDADFAVALRCALLAGREATLYAGAGFVAGSDPRQELAETEAKFSPMLAALRRAVHATHATHTTPAAHGRDAAAGTGT